MKTLVIHPHDYSTNFLSGIYEGKGFTVISDNPTHSYLKNQIKQHDRIIMLGHGDKTGLFGFGRMIVDSNLVYLLRGKNLIGIWCNADQFFQKYNITGFYTGMFISEMDEAYYEGLHDFSLKDINLSNSRFASILGTFLDSPAILEDVKKNYNDDTNNIVLFNNDRLFFN